MKGHILVILFEIIKLLLIRIGNVFTEIYNKIYDFLEKVYKRLS